MKKKPKKIADAAHPLRESTNQNGNFKLFCAMILLVDQLEMSNDCFDNIISKASTFTIHTFILEYFNIKE